MTDIGASGMDAEELPPGWAWAKLDELGLWTGGGTPSKAKPDYWHNGTVPWVSPKDMKKNLVGGEAEKITIAAVANSAAKMVPEGSLLCVIRSGILNHTFPVALAECDLTINQDMRALTTHTGVSAEYVALFLKARNNEILHTCAKDGTTVASIEVRHLQNLSVPVAPSAEQARLVGTVTALFEELNEAEAALARAREGVERFRASLLHAACTGQLTADWRAQNPPSETGADLLRRILTERRAAWERTEHARLQAKGISPRGDAWKARYVEPVTPDLTDMPDLPEGWVWASLDMLLLRIEAGKNVSALARPPDAGETGIVKVSAVTWGEFDEDASKTLYPTAEIDPSHVIRVGDFLISRANTLELVGAPVVVKSCRRRLVLSDKILRFQFALDLRKWTELVLKSSIGRVQIERYAQGAQLSMRNISQDNFRRMAIPVPPTPESDHAMSVVSDGLDAMEMADGDIAASLRQSILHAAFTGRLVPQNAADEPAAALLARLRAAPAASRRTKRRARMEYSA